MKRLPCIDFAEQTRLRPAGTGLVVVASALLLASSALAWRAEKTNSALAERLKDAKSAQAPRMVMSAADRTLLAQARTVASQLNAPWDELLAVFEEHSSPGVGLLKLEPDAKAAIVRVTAQSSNVDSMVAYVEALEGDSRLTEVILANHQVERETAGRPLRFTLVASWRPAAAAGSPPPTRVAKASP